MLNIRRETIISYAFIERNFNLLKRYLNWEILFFSYSIVNALTIGLIMVGRGSSQDVLYLVIGALIWGFLSIMMREVSDAITWERWEGTIEYTFMAPIYRITHLVGSCLFAILYGLLRTGLVLAIMPLFFGEHIDLGSANWITMGVTVAVSSLSFIGIGLMAAIFPLLSPEKGQAATGILQSVLLLISGIYYEIEVLPDWLQPFSIISPATYTLRSIRAAMLENASVQSQAENLLLLLVIGIVLIPLGFWVFHIAERYAKRVGRLKRSG
ncbi:MAG: ABC transporter permease [Candidatus Poribacteria bacterium]|nr:ABC transporter permease [Candidatus Poribacteria bacterium]